MDTSSLAVIVGHWKRLAAAGGQLMLAGARYKYTKTLWITGLADRLPMYDSVDTALAAGRQRRTRLGQAPASVSPPGSPHADGDEAGVVLGVGGRLGDHVVGVAADLGRRVAGDPQQRVQGVVDGLVAPLDEAVGEQQQDVTELAAR